MALTLVTAFAVAGSASAAPGNGATKINQEYCTTNQFGTACFDLNTIVNTTVTPSGNVSYVTNGQTEIRNNPSFVNCTFIGRSKFHDHYLFKDGVFHERGDHQESSLERQCPGGVHEKCTFTRRAHMVDGEFQYLITDFRCTPL
ncbi:MAG: hypothetical protein M3R46_05640 [Actinomycetota bacterium]|nr:hypothetical protein [Actinomycetota bacterium]